MKKPNEKLCTSKETNIARLCSNLHDIDSDPSAQEEGRQIF